MCIRTKINANKYLKLSGRRGVWDAIPCIKHRKGDEGSHLDARENHRAYVCISIRKTWPYLIVIPLCVLYTQLSILIGRARFLSDACAINRSERKSSSPLLACSRIKRRKCKAWMENTIMNFPRYYTSTRLDGCLIAEHKLCWNVMTCMRNHSRWKSSEATVVWRRNQSLPATDRKYKNN